MHDKNLQNYFDYLALPLEQLDGQSICPFIKQFKNNIQTKHSLDIVTDLKNVIANFPIDKKIFILYNEYIDSESLNRYCNDFQSYANSKDLWVVFDHPDCNNFIGGIKTNNQYYGLLLIQPLREIITRSEEIAKDTNYYSFWDEVYYNEIVVKRKELMQ